ncbi:MAG: ATP-binding cassette domain-containing protein, partial [Chitinivibrionales bacterium]|nr:ATP-binding cassette domain-containing protein [Chitinivibrionales bacterium]
MDLVNVRNLSKHFKTLNRHEGLIGAITDLFSRDYSIVRAVDDISMSIHAGEIVGFVGPNGAGKSTTIKMLTGVLQPTSGVVTVNNFTPYKQRRRYIKQVGIVFGQRSQLWWDIPVIESFKLLKEIYGISQSNYSQTMALYDDLVNLKELHAIPVRKLSLGQRMLCDIAASVLHSPTVLFLDEPTIGLDVAIKEKIRTLIRMLNEQKRTTVLLTTHDVKDIEKLCKRIILIDKGVIIFDGPIEKFNTIFGTYRTLQLHLCDSSPESDGLLSSTINQTFSAAGPIMVERQEQWLNITVNQEAVRLMDILSFVIGKFAVQDVKIIEIELENIIRKV